MGDLSRDFSAHEFACGCCGQIVVHDRLIEALQDLRDLAGEKIKILSGYRCDKKNKSVGGSKDSWHLSGMAADIVIERFSMLEVFALAEDVMAFRTGGIGIYPDSMFLHLDVRPGGPARWARIRKRYVAFHEGFILQLESGNEGELPVAHEREIEMPVDIPVSKSRLRLTQARRRLERRDET